VRLIISHFNFHFLLFIDVGYTGSQHKKIVSSGENVQLVSKHLLTDELGMELAWKGLNGRSRFRTRAFSTVIGKFLISFWIHFAQSVILSFFSYFCSCCRKMNDWRKYVIEDINREWIWTAKRATCPVPTALSFDAKSIFSHCTATVSVPLCKPCNWR
jgi:hypothetical protein